jgi:aminopeptidase C
LNAFLKGNKTGIYELQQAKAGSIQGHAVTLVGYNNTAGYWVVKNSFGPDWGNGGFFKASDMQLSPPEALALCQLELLSAVWQWAGMVAAATAAA